MGINLSDQNVLKIAYINHTKMVLQDVSIDTGVENKEGVTVTRTGDAPVLRKVTATKTANKKPVARKTIRKR